MIRIGVSSRMFRSTLKTSANLSQPDADSCTPNPCKPGFSNTPYNPGLSPPPITRPARSDAQKEVNKTLTNMLPTRTIARRRCGSRKSIYAAFSPAVPFDMRLTCARLRDIKAVSDPEKKAEKNSNTKIAPLNGKYCSTKPIRNPDKIEQNKLFKKIT